MTTDKVLIIGGKGTGKSYMYQALKQSEIIAELKQRANCKDNFTFIYTVDKRDRIFRVNNFASTSFIKINQV